MFIICSESRTNPGQIIYLVDRTFIKNKWWTENINEAMQFNKLEAAKYTLNSLKYNNPRIMNTDTKEFIDDNLPKGVL